MTAPKNARATALSTFLLVCLATVQPSAVQAQCNGRDPGFGVTDNLWIDGVWRPGLSGLAQNQIPERRDSTRWDSLSTPGYDSNNEIFESVDVLGDYLYVAYNAGLQVWNIAGNNAENPEFIQARDGWNGFFCRQTNECIPFLDFPPISEVDFLVEDVFAIEEPGTGNHLIALSGKSPVGLALFHFNTTTETMTQIYQDTTTSSRQVRLTDFNDGGGTKIYAFSAGEAGIDVYDVTRASALASCLVTTSATTQCPGVWIDKLGDLTTSSYIDILKRNSGSEILVATSNGANSNLGLELWTVQDPTSPSTAIELFSGLDERTYGVALFSYQSNDYLAVVERETSSANAIRIFSVNQCRGGGCTLGSPVWDTVTVPPFVSRQYLTFSTSNGTPFLYYGLAATLIGAQVEQLFNLTSLTPTAPNGGISEITTGGPTYSDACTSLDLDYWAWYYPGNEFGLGNFSPRIGKFDSNTNFFYRAAGGVMDVHVWLAGIVAPEPEVTTSVKTPDPEGLYWSDDMITFEATGDNGCVAGGTWNWTPTVPSEITAVASSPTGNEITYEFQCNTTERCADAVVSVAASNTDASCAGADEIAAVITVKDPRPEVVSISPATGTVTQCNPVDFTAEILGRGPLSTAWNVNGVETDTGTASDEDLSQSTPMFQWDPATATFNTLFVDGFESGNTSAWGAPPVVLEDFTIELSLDSGAATGTATSTLSSIQGTPAFDTPAIEATTADSSSFDFHANTVPGTVAVWDWEIEDNEGTETCSFDPAKSCVNKSGQDISHTWILQTGAKRVDVTLSSCQSVETPSASTSVSVVSAEPLAITKFQLDRSASGSSCTIDFTCIVDLLCVCRDDLDITFTLEATGSPLVYDFDWNGDGTFEETNVTNSGTSYTHLYTQPIGQVIPKAKARRGAATPSERNLRETLDIEP